MQKKRKKGLWAAFLSLLMVVSMLPISAFAQETTVTEVKDAAGLKAALENGGSVKLTDSFSIDEKLDINITKPVELDLNGQTVTKTYGEINHFFITIKDGGSLTLNDSGESGALVANDSSYGYGIQLYNGAAFIMNGGKIETHEESIDVYTDANAKIEINGGEVISTNDNVLGVRGGTTTINGGKLTSGGRTGVYISTYSSTPIDFTMSGGTLVANDCNSGAIQAYQGANVTITGDATVQANNCYGIQAQENVVLNVSGNGSIISTGNPPAISVSDEAKVNISDGTVSSEKGAAIRTEDNATVTISGGSLTGGSSKGAIEKYESITGGTNNSSIRITGGIFSSDVSEYVDKNVGGLVPNPDGDGFIIAEYVAFNGENKYTSIQAAIDNASADDTILVADGLHEEHITIDKAVTLKNAEGANPQVTDITAIGDIDGLTFEGLTFVGASNVKSLDTNLSALYLQGSSLMKNVTVKNCDFVLNNDYVTANSGSAEDYSTIAITTLNVEGLTVEGCTIDGYTISAYHNPGNGGNITYKDNTIKNVKSGIAFIATDGITVTGNTFENANGIRLEDNWGGGDKCSDVTIEQNKFISVSSDDAYGQYAIRTEDSNGNPGFEGTLELKENYWGENPDFDALVVGNVETNVYPYYVDTEMTQLVTAANGIAINYSAEMEVGETLQLTATVSPDNADDKTVTWSSSDDSIATVDQNGLVTAKAEGKVVITATNSAGQSANCMITVKAASTDNSGNNSNNDNQGNGTASEVTPPSENGGSSTPQTGDFSNMMPWMVVMLLALSASVACVLNIKKNRVR
ncbi:MAG TPA: Ig-like domain-containing protein [Firmicutes bacterium]|nr:Ig-like domain-containing protein [Bacillota bacterium]